MFDLDAEIFEQQIWETIYKNERKKAPIGWGRTMRVMVFKDLITLWGNLIPLSTRT